MVNIAIVWLCTIMAIRVDAFAARGLPSPKPSVSKCQTPIPQKIFLSDMDESYWKRSSCHSTSELCSSPAHAIEQNDVPNRIIMDKRSTKHSFSVAMLSLVSLLAIELGARTTDSLNFAISTRLLSVHFWSALTPFSAIAVRLAPIPTMMKIRKSGVGGLPLLPYTAMTNLSFVLLMYGIITSDPQIMIIYSIGLAMSLYYCAQFLSRCPENASHLPRTAQFHKRVSLGIISFVLCSTIFLGKELASRIVGVTSVILSCSMYISPLTKMFKAISERSAKDIPLPFAVVGLVNTFSWVIHGFFAKKDFVLWLPCAIGVLSTSTQIMLNVLLRENKSPDGMKSQTL